MVVSSSRFLLLLALGLGVAACGDKSADDTGASEGTGGGGDDAGDDGSTGDEGTGTGDDTAEEDCEDPTPWFYDADGDGFGDPDLSTEACVAPPGYVALADDCDDLRPDVNPGVADLCNLEDDDCDGVIDEDAPTSTWFPDLDGDGFGDPGAPREACSQPEGFLTDDSDCDDAEGDIHPGADEVCGDGVDSDCDGAIFVCVPEDLHDLQAEAIRVEGVDAGEHLAERALVTDFNLDGQDDLLLSTTEADSEAGVVFGWLGPITADRDARDADFSVTGMAASDKLGRAMASGFDGDLDGYEDLFISAWEADGDDLSNEGKSYLFTGPTTGGTFGADDADGVWEGQTIARSGASFATGDFDDDGDIDVFIGAPSTITTAHSSSGAWLLRAPFDTSDDRLLYVALVTIAPAQKTLGAEAMVGADVNGDGVDDLVVSDEMYTTNAYGVVNALLGPITDYAYWDDNGLEAEGTQTGQLLGRALSAGDLDGDGYDDVLAGAPGDDSTATGGGAVYVLPGRSSGMGNLSAATARVRCDLPDAALGSAVEVISDLDGDGLPEVLLGGPGEDDGAGTTWLFLGPMAGTLDAEDDARASFNTSDYDAVGSSLQLASDLTGDGVPDIVVGAPTDQANGEAGAAWIFPISAGY